jgi:hypothetical protein
MTQIKELLEQLNQNKKLDSSTLERLDREGYIRISNPINYQTPTGQREYLFIDFTEKGRKLLKG